MKEITGGKGLMIGLVGLSDIRASSDYELLCILKRTVAVIEERLTEEEAQTNAQLPRAEIVNLLEWWLRCHSVERSRELIDDTNKMILQLSALG